MEPPEPDGDMLGKDGLALYGAVELVNWLQFTTGVAVRNRVES